MRFFVYENGGVVEGYVTMTGMDLKGFLKLRTDPANDKEAATRRYVLNKINSFNASNILRDNFTVERMPGFEGDFVSSPGTGVLELEDTGVISASYPKVTVDSKGRVTAGSSLVYGDIPLLPWEKVTTDKPTTIEGFGITDAVEKSGGMVTGEILMNRKPQTSSEVATVGYLKDVLGGLGSMIPGQIVASPSVETPSGFLICNGAYVKKTQYPNLYSFVGDKFNQDYVGFGFPWLNQYDIHNESVSTLGPWVNSDPIPEPLQQTQAVVTNNRVFLLGGHGTVAGGEAATSADIFSAEIDLQGNIQTWSSVGVLPEAVSNHITLAIKDKLYVFGGRVASVLSKNVQVSTIDASGNLGTWTAALELPGVVSGGVGFCNKDFVYIVSSENTNIYKGTLDVSGNITGWTTVVLGLPVTVKNASLSVIKDVVYVIGGNDGTVCLDTVYKAHMLPDGDLGEWSLVTGQLPETISHGKSFVSNNNLWLIGGSSDLTGTVSSDVVFKAAINQDGSLGAWGAGGNLTEGLSRHAVVITSSKLYILGGKTTLGVSSVRHMLLPGGKSNYSKYYSSVSVDTGTDFRLPDYEGIKHPTGRLFIKY